MCRGKGTRSSRSLLLWSSLSYFCIIEGTAVGLVLTGLTFLETQNVNLNSFLEQRQTCSGNKWGICRISPSPSCRNDWGPCNSHICWSQPGTWSSSSPGLSRLAQTAPGKSKQQLSAKVVGISSYINLIRVYVLNILILIISSEWSQSGDDILCVMISACY